MKDYYKILGVLENAEDVVIKAAYRVLAQKYHPDKWKGESDTAQQKMTLLNEAYAVLSNPEQRRAYDTAYFDWKKNETKNENDDEEIYGAGDEYSEVWQLGLEYFHDLDTRYNQLKRISQRLANTFKATIIENKDFANAYDLSQRLEEAYLIKYYGDTKEIRAYAKELLLGGHAKAAIEVNRVVRLLGNSVPLPKLKSTIEKKFDLTGSRAKREKTKQEGNLTELERIISIAETGELTPLAAIRLIELAIKGSVSRENGTWVIMKGSKRHQTMRTEQDFLQYAYALARWAKTNISDQP